MSELVHYTFAPGLNLRCIDIGGVPYFVAKDACDALGMRVDNAIRHLDEDEKANTKIEGFARGATLVNESGLFAIVLKSRKPAARAFQRWVTGIVLPTLRQDGVYIAGQEQALPEDITEGELLARMEAIQDRLDAFKAVKLAEFKARSQEHRDDRYVALKTLKRIQSRTRGTTHTRKESTR